MLTMQSPTFRELTHDEILATVKALNSQISFKENIIKSRMTREIAGEHIREAAKALQNMKTALLKLQTKLSH